MQVLKTLQVLLQGNFTMQELIERLNKSEEEPVFNNSVISKYINTCRYCGINILKIHNRYFVASMPFGLELTSGDIGLLERLQNIIRFLIILLISLIDFQTKALQELIRKHIIFLQNSLNMQLKIKEKFV